MKTPVSNTAKILCAAAMAMVLAAPAAFALEVADLKRDGIACEEADGTLRVLKPTPEIDEFVKSKNAERKAKYKEIAAGQSTKEKPVSADDVGKLTAAKLDHRCN